MSGTLQMQREDTTNIMSKKNVENIENTKAAIEEGRELSMREKVAAYMANHAAEHFAAACNDVELDDVEELLNNTKKEEGVYWVFTCPVIGGTNSKTGKPNPTKEEWENANPDAVRVDNLAGRQWYKKPKTLNDASDIVTIASGWNRYNDAIEGAQKKVQNMAEGGKLAFSTMTKEEKAAYLAELQAMLAE